METTDTRVNARIWFTPADWETDQEGTAVELEVDRDEPNEIAIHTFQNGEGSKVSFYVDRETALELGVRLINAARLR